MKVALIANLTSFHSSFNLSNIEILINLGCEVHLFSNDGNDPDQLTRFKLFCNKKHIIMHNIEIPRKPIHLIRIIRSYLKISQYFKENRFSLIHSHTPIGGLMGRLIAIRYSIKNIYSAHGLHFYKGAPILNWVLYYPIERILALFTQAIIAINNEDFIRLNKWKSSKVFFVPGVGVNYSKYYSKSKNRKNSRITLLSVGELNKNKNHSFVIDILTKHNINVNYLIAGSGVLRDKLQSMINKSSANNSIKLLGYVDDVAELYSISDIFVFPSIREGLPVSIMEAMSSGLAVIASDIRGNRDLVQNNFSGFLYKPGNELDFLNKLNILIHNKQLRTKMASFNQNNIKSYDQPTINSYMKKIYSEFLDEN